MLPGSAGALAGGADGVVLSGETGLTEGVSSTPVVPLGALVGGTASLEGEQRELSGKRSQRIFLPSDESSNYLAVPPDWARTALLLINRAKAVPIKVRYFTFTPLNLKTLF